MIDLNRPKKAMHDVLSCMAFRVSDQPWVSSMKETYSRLAKA